MRKSGLLERLLRGGGSPVRGHHPHPRPGLPASSTPTPRPGPGATPRAAATCGAATPTDGYLADNLVGTVEQVAEKAQAFVDAGCRGLILWLRDYPADETLRRFMAEVVPALRVP